MKLAARFAEPEIAADIGEPIVAESSDETCRDEAVPFDADQADALRTVGVEAASRPATTAPAYPPTKSAPPARPRRAGARAGSLCRESRSRCGDNQNSAANRASVRRPSRRAAASR